MAIMFWQHAVPIWHRTAEWQRKLSTFGLFLFGIWAVLHIVVWPCLVLAGRENEKQLVACTG
jgi:hypothetical protein